MLRVLLILLIWALMLFVGLFYISSSGILATMGLGCCLASMFFLSFVEPYVWLLNRPAGKISASLFFISSIFPAVEMAPMVPRLLWCGGRRGCFSIDKLFPVCYAVFISSV